MLTNLLIAFAVLLGIAITNGGGPFGTSCEKVQHDDVVLA